MSKKKGKKGICVYTLISRVIYRKEAGGEKRGKKKEKGAREGKKIRGDLNSPF